MTQDPQTESVLALARAPVAGAVASIEKTAQPWRLGGLSPWQVIVRSWRCYSENRFNGRSAQFAYYSMLSVFPLLILVIAVIARLPLSGVVENALEAARNALAVETYRVLERQVREIQDHSTPGLIAVSLAVLTIAGSQVLLTITDGMNLAYGVKETRRTWHVYGMAVLLNVAASLLFLVALVLMVAGPVLSTWIAAHGFTIPVLQTVLRSGVRWGVVCGCLWLYTAAIYCVVPSLKLPWYWLSPGSAFAVAGWVVVSQGFRLYVENLGRYNETYGTIGGVIVLMIWLDLTGAVLLMGGQINGVIHRAEVESAGAAKLES
jgi:membrane protein